LFRLALRALAAKILRRVFYRWPTWFHTDSFPQPDFHFQTQEFQTVPLPEIPYCPAPDKYTVCGLLLASSFTTILAFLAATSLGANVTVIVQLGSGATELMAPGLPCSFGNSCRPPRTVLILGNHPRTAVRRFALVQVPGPAVATSVVPSATSACATDHEVQLILWGTGVVRVLVIYVGLVIVHRLHADVVQVGRAVRIEGNETTVAAVHGRRPLPAELEAGVVAVKLATPGYRRSAGGQARGKLDRHAAQPILASQVVGRQGGVPAIVHRVERRAGPCGRRVKRDETVWNIHRIASSNLDGLVVEGQVRERADFLTGGLEHSVEPNRAAGRNRLSIERRVQADFLRNQRCGDGHVRGLQAREMHGIPRVACHEFVEVSLYGRYCE
jgi:hypothetical protein